MVGFFSLLSHRCYNRYRGKHWSFANGMVRCLIVLYCWDVLSGGVCGFYRGKYLEEFSFVVTKQHFSMYNKAIQQQTMFKFIKEVNMNNSQQYMIYGPAGLGINIYGTAEQALSKASYYYTISPLRFRHAVEKLERDGLFGYSCGIDYIVVEKVNP